MIPRTLLIFAVFAGSVSAAPVPKELKQKSDIERIQGVWAVEGGGTRWYFAGEKLFAGGTNTTDAKGQEYGIAVRANGAVREMDVWMQGRLTHSCIYKFVEDDIHIAYVGGERRPTDFAQAGSTKHVLKRIVEAKK